MSNNSISPVGALTSVASSTAESGGRYSKAIESLVGDGTFANDINKLVAKATSVTNINTGQVTTDAINLHIKISNVQVLGGATKKLAEGVNALIKAQ